MSYSVKQYRQWADFRDETGFRSKFEQEVNARLQGIDARYEEKKISYEVLTTRFYLPDWILPAQAIVLEAKGRFTKEDRDKMLLVKRKYPDLDIRLVFMSLKEKVGRTATVADWCKKNGFPCCKGPEIPESWLNHKPSKASRKAFDSILKIKEQHE